jgi:hypothetical protein
MNQHPRETTKAVKCSDCKGNGTYYKEEERMDLTSRNQLSVATCIGRGYILKELDQLAGLKFTPPSLKWHSANGFSTSKEPWSFLSVLHSQRVWMRLSISI